MRMRGRGTILPWHPVSLDQTFACTLTYTMSFVLAYTTTCTFACTLTYTMSFAIAYTIACTAAYTNTCTFACTLTYTMSFAIAYTLAYTVANTLHSLLSKLLSEHIH